MCDCYPGCWADHAKDWHKTDITELVNAHAVEQPDTFYPEMAVTKQIVQSENIPYGEYVVLFEKGRHLLAVAPSHAENLVQRHPCPSTRGQS
jgi:hypothetical protein